MGFPSGSNCKESACNAGDQRSIPGSEGKIPWRREWLPTSVFLPGEYHEMNSPAGFSPWGRKELDHTEWLTPSQFWRLEVWDWGFDKLFLLRSLSWAHKRVIFSLGPRVVIPLWVYVLIPSYKNTNQIRSGPTLMTSFHLLTSLKTLSSNTVTSWDTGG